MFRKGENGGASRKGKPNKSNADVKAVIEAIIPREERIALLAGLARGILMKDEKTKLVYEKEPNYKALELLSYYADGKPRETVDLNHSGGVKFIKNDIPQT